jgi:hypothetical protein
MPEGDVVWCIWCGILSTSHVSNRDERKMNLTSDMTASEKIRNETESSPVETSPVQVQRQDWYKSHWQEDGYDNLYRRRDEMLRWGC